MTDEQRTWGGSRPGAGRKHLNGSAPGEGERLKTYPVTLPAAMADALRDLGDGNLSAGIRIMYERMKDDGTNHND